jgi:hypothetical protein
MSLTTTEAKEISPELILNRMDEFLENKRRTSVHRSNWASLLGEECDRARYLWRVSPELAAPIEIEGLRSIENGMDEEKACKDYLSGLGFTVYVDRPEAKGRWEKFNISAWADFWISVNGSAPVIAEHKAPASEWTWKKINSFTDLKDSTSQWHQKWYFQCQVTMLVNNEERLMFFLKRPGKKEWKIFWIPLDMTDAEIAIQRAERDEIAVQTQTVPEFLEGDTEHCQRCPFFGRVCNPPLNFMPARFVDSEDFVTNVKRWQELKPLAKEYNDLDEEIKAPFKRAECAVGGPILAGPFEIVVKGSERKPYQVKGGWSYTVKINELDQGRKIKEPEEEAA